MSEAAGWYHLRLKTISRSHGRSSVAAAAYRLGARFEDERARIVHDYRARGGVEASFTVARSDAPDWVHDPERLWNAAERADNRINSTLAREIELALPAIVTDEARLAITESMASELVERYGVAVSAAIHRPSAEGDQRNHHAHILFTTRVVDAGGFAGKTRILDDRKSGPEETHYLREYACQLLNDALADAGSDERVDHRSFETRGIDREPTQHLGPDATEIMRQGRDSLIAEDNDAVRERNADRALLENLKNELADLDAEIIRLEAEQLAQDRGETAPLADARPEAIGDVSIVQLREPDSEARHVEVQAEPLNDFDAIHADTIQIAKANEALGRHEDTMEPGARFARVRAWWENLCTHFVEWRDQLRVYLHGFNLHWPGDTAPADGGLARHVSDSDEAGFDGLAPLEMPDQPLPFHGRRTSLDPPNQPPDPPEPEP